MVREWLAHACLCSPFPQWFMHHWAGSNLCTRPSVVLRCVLVKRGVRRSQVDAWCPRVDRPLRRVLEAVILIRRTQLRRPGVLRLGPSEGRLLRESLGRQEEVAEGRVAEVREELRSCRAELAQARKRQRGQACFFPF